MRRIAALLAGIAGLALAACALAYQSVGEVRIEALPPEVRATLVLIRKGGPYPYRKDGSVFGNREGLLPKRPRGHYREFTVKTPGRRDRGARRIVVLRGAPGEVYYTDDHYRSFRRILE